MQCLSQTFWTKRYFVDSLKYLTFIKCMPSSSGCNSWFTSNDKVGRSQCGIKWISWWYDFYFLLPYGICCSCDLFSSFYNFFF